MLNMLCDILPYLLIGIVGLVKVNVLINYVGDVGNGYYQVINQIIAYVFLAQAGFGDAVIYRLYKPFANRNKDDVNAVYSGARRVFKIIGLIILAIIFIVTICLYFFIISTSYLISYFGRGQTYMCVLSANQEKYIYSLTTNLLKLLCDILIVLVTIKFSTLEAIAVVILFVKIIEEIILRIVVSYKYKWLKQVADADTSMVKMTKDLAWTQIGYLVLNNIDSLLLVSFIGPISVSIYTSYNFILRFLNEIASRIELSAVYSFGNVFAKNENDRIYPLYREFLALFIIIAFSMCLTFALGIRSFVSVWINDISYIVSYTTVILFTFATFLNILYYPLVALINANGLFKDNKRHIFICASINLILSLILIKPFGMNGILFATALAFLVNIFLKTNLVSKKILKDVNHYEILKSFIMVIVIFGILSYLLKPLELVLLNGVNGLFTCIITIGIIFVVIMILVFGILYLINKDTRNLYKRAINLVKRKLKRN